MVSIETTPKTEVLQRFLLPWLELEWPATWNEVFERSAPIQVEIGFGNGAFLLELAIRQPDRNFLGIEVSWRSIKRLLRRIDKRGLENIRIVNGGAQAILSHLFKPNSIEEVYINFPDPWPKERNHQRRLIRPEFLELLAEKTVPGGWLNIATDHADYAAWIADVLEGQSFFTSCYPTTAVHELPGRIQTKYESKAVAEGVPIHYFVWKKQAEPERLSNAEKVNEMPNVVLKSQDAEEIFDDFCPQEWVEEHRGEQVVVKFLRAYRQVGQPHLLVEVMVREESFTQVFGIAIRERKDGRLVVKPSKLGQPRPTWGVKRAVWHTANLILRENREIELVKSTVGDFER